MDGMKPLIANRKWPLRLAAPTRVGTASACLLASVFVGPLTDGETNKAHAFDQQETQQRSIAEANSPLEQRLENLEQQLLENQRTIDRSQEALLQAQTASQSEVKLTLSLTGSFYELNENSRNDGFCGVRVRFNLQNQTTNTVAMLTSIFSTGKQFSRDMPNPRNAKWADSSYSDFDETDWNTIPGLYDGSWGAHTWTYEDAAARALWAYLNDEMVNAEYQPFYTTSENNSTVETIRFSLPISTELANCLHTLSQ